MQEGHRDRTETNVIVAPKHFLFVFPKDVQFAKLEYYVS